MRKRQRASFHLVNMQMRLSLSASVITFSLVPALHLAQNNRQCECALRLDRRILPTLLSLYPSSLGTNLRLPPSRLRPPGAHISLISGPFLSDISSRDCNDAWRATESTNSLPSTNTHHQSSRHRGGQCSARRPRLVTSPTALQIRSRV